jgi:orotidine-5'-phosphate decarboxylase
VTERSFLEKWRSAAADNRSLLCVGLDPEPSRMPVEDVATFNREIIEATKDLVCAYKPNIGFYEALGAAGYAALAQTREIIPEDIPVIGDVKRGDVPNTAHAYARAMYDTWRFDAVTINPYLGFDAVDPFLRPGKLVFLLCRTSNPGAGAFQDLAVGDDRHPLYEEVALRARDYDSGEADLGLVVGATYPEEAKRLRKLAAELPFLVPGLGAQGGELEAAVAASLDRDGMGAVFNASRGVLYASQGKDFPEAARQAAEGLRDAINAVRDEQVIRRQVKSPMDLRSGDQVRLKDPHACGGDEWEVTRLGADIGLRCLRCGRQVMLDRVRVERRIKAFLQRGKAEGTPAALA